MRTNKFGDQYCHTADEARKVIDESENGWEVYIPHIEPPADGEKASAEVSENGSGDLVCFIEADTVDAVKAIAAELKIEVG